MMECSDKPKKKIKGTMWKAINTHDMNLLWPEWMWRAIKWNELYGGQMRKKK